MTQQAIKGRSERLRRSEATLTHIHQLTLAATAVFIPFLIWGIYNQDLNFSVVIAALMAMSGYLCWKAAR